LPWIKLCNGWKLTISALFVVRDKECGINTLVHVCHRYSAALCSPAYIINCCRYNLPRCTIRVVEAVPDNCFVAYCHITDHFSGPGREIGPVCVSVWVSGQWLELHDLWPRYLARRFFLIISRSKSKVKVVLQRSRYRHVTRWLFWLLDELFVLKWLVRPRVRAVLVIDSRIM